MTRERHQRIYSLTAGDFQATVYPAGKSAFLLDLYHAGGERLHPRFICTGEEAAVISRLAATAQALIDDLAKGRSYEQWCSEFGVDPFVPELP